MNHSASRYDVVPYHMIPYHTMFIYLCLAQLLYDEVMMSPDMQLAQELGPIVQLPLMAM